MPLEVNKCCFFVDLRTGSLIIGYLNLLWNVVVTGTLISGLVVAAEALAGAKDPDTETAIKIAIAILAIALVFVFANIIFCALLLIGIHKTKPGHVKAYLIYTSIFVVFSIIAFGASIGQGAAAVDIVRNFFSLLFSIYYLIVIRSYYLKMEYAPPMMQV